MTTKFTIVTVCYNAVKELEETMLSVLGQDYPNVEYIVIDGGSTDGTVDVIRKYADRLAYWVSEPDKGIYDAMNKGIAAATGDYINFMNAGDRFASYSIISQIAERNQSATVIYGNTINILNDRTHLIKPAKLHLMRRRGVICHQSAFIMTDYHKKHPYDTKYRSLADFCFFREAYMSDHTFKYLDIPISIFDLGDGMCKNPDLHYRELAQITGRNSVFDKFVYGIKRGIAKIRLLSGFRF